MNVRRKLNRKVLELYQTGWDRAAEDWSEFVESPRDSHRHLVYEPALLKALGPLRGRDVLELGCGQGSFSRVLQRRGANVVAIDLSPKQISLAERSRRVGPHPIHYICGDAGLVAKNLPERSVDVAVASMSLMDFHNPRTVFRTIRRCLRPDGRLVFSVVHPVTGDRACAGWLRRGKKQCEMRFVDNYFVEGPWVWKWRPPGSQRTMKVVNWHRTLETWSRELSDAGFLIHRLAEPRPSKDEIARDTKLRDLARVPFYLIIEAIPIGQQARSAAHP